MVESTTKSTTINIPYFLSNDYIYILSFEVIQSYRMFLGCDQLLFNKTMMQP